MGRNKAKAAAESPQAEDFMSGMSLLEGFAGNDWAASGAAGWENPIIPEEYEDEDDDEEDDDEDDEDDGYEEMTQQTRQRHFKGQQQPQNRQKHNQNQHKHQNQHQHQTQHQHQYQNQNQNSNGQPHKQKGNKGNQNQQGPQKGQRNQQNPQKNQNPKQQNQKKNKKNQKNQDGPMGQDRQQDPHGEATWGTRDGSYSGRVGGGNSGGDSDLGVHLNQYHSNNLREQQHRLASLLDEIPPERGRARGSTQQHQQWVANQERIVIDNIMAASNGQTPSRTLWYAATGSSSSVLDGGARAGPHATIQIIESGGAGLEDARRALYSRERLASKRIHWMFSPTKDERVASLLEWIQAMSHGLATLGVHKFLRTQQRGALIVNADFRPERAPTEPAFDWITFDEVVGTYDKILQESMAFYEPDRQVLVFVFLLSHTGNSVAMWRRKLPIPVAVHNQNRTEIKRLMTSLAQRRYVVTVDEMPPAPPIQKSKKKWYNVRW